MREITRPEGVYGYTCGHIYFDCKCGSTKCHYERSREDCDEVEESVESASKHMIDTKEWDYPESKHTFYANSLAFKMIFDDVDFFIKNDLFKDSGLSLICNGCKNKFTFTPEIVEELNS